MFKHVVLEYVYYFIYVSIIFFFITFLNYVIGIDLKYTGIINVIALIVLVFSSLLQGFLADRFLGNKKSLIINLSLSILVLIGFIIFRNPIIVTIMYILIWSTFVVLAPIIDGLVLKNVESNKYGYVRAAGSFGAACSYFLNSLLIGSIPLGKVSEIFNSISSDSQYYIIFFIDIILIIVMLVTIMFIKEAKYSSKVEYKVGIKYILKSRNLMLIMIITLLSYGVLSADDAYNYQFNNLVAKIDPVVIAVVGFVSIFTEVILMTLYEKFLSRLNIKLALSIAITCLLLIFLSKYFFYTNKTIINLGNISLGIYVGIFVPTTIHYISKNSVSSVRNTILSMQQAAIRIGGILLGIVTSTYYNITENLPGIYIVHAFVVLIALVFVFMISESKGVVDEIHE